MADPSEGSGSADAARDTASIKHPYVCILTFGHKHQVIVTLDQGATPSDVRETPEFKQAWGTEPVRLALRKDVGQSALNLVSQMSRLSLSLPPPSPPVLSPSVSPLSLPLALASHRDGHDRVKDRVADGAILHMQLPGCRGRPRGRTAARMA